MKDIEIALTDFEIYMAAQVGARRRINGSLKGKLKDTIDCAKHDWNNDIEAACAEVAFAKATNQFWNGSVNTFRLPDVGSVNVRHTEHNDGHLIIRSWDKMGEYVLVTGKCPAFVVRGREHSSSVMTPQFRHDNKSWWMPQSYLKEL